VETTQEFTSVLAKLPYPGYLVRLDNIEDMDGHTHRAYVWQFFDPQGGERVAAFAVKDGTYLTDVMPEEKP